MAAGSMVYDFVTGMESRLWTTGVAWTTATYPRGGSVGNWFPLTRFNVPTGSLDTAASDTPSLRHFGRNNVHAEDYTRLDKRHQFGSKGGNRSVVRLLGRNRKAGPIRHGVQVGAKHGRALAGF